MIIRSSSYDENEYELTQPIDLYYKTKASFIFSIQLHKIISLFLELAMATQAGNPSKYLNIIIE
jgi:hypothetical protein